MDGAGLDQMFRVKGSRYMLPEYQRGYSWQSDHVDQFLRDLENTKADENNHFFGYILTAQDKHPSEQVIKIIDGQQRMTTATLFLICARNFFFKFETESSLAKRYLEELEERLYTSEKSEPNLKQPVLKLSNTNNQLFIDLIERVKIDKTPQSNFRKKHDSNMLLHRAYKRIQEWFLVKIREYETNSKNTDPKELILEIREYVLTLFEKFIIQRSHYDSQNEAYEIFNLVNNRGVNLTDSDLIKSYLFGKFLRSSNDIESNLQTNTNSIEHYDERWNTMRSIVTSKEKSAYKDLNTFLSHYLIAFNSDKLRNKTDRRGKAVTLKPSQKQMYGAFKRLVETRTPANIIDDLHKWSEVLEKLRNPSDEVKFEKYPNLVHYLKKIKDVGAVFVYPIILAGFQKYWDKGDAKTFEALVMMCFKYHVRVKLIGTAFTLTQYEQTMYKIIEKMQEGESLKSIIRYLMDKPRYYPINDDVIRPLERLHLRTSAHIIAVLEEAEFASVDKLSRNDVSVEHIMPKDFDSWSEYIARTHDINSKDPNTKINEAQKIHEDNFDCLGNLTLLSGKDNLLAGTKSFEDKLKIYKNHQTYEITKKLLNKTKWDVHEIKTRKEELAKIILKEIDLENILDRL